VQVADAVKRRLEALKPQLPAGLRIDVVRDQSVYIKNSVASLEEHLVLGSLLASFIVFLFIRDLRTVLIAFIAIPASIIATFTLIRLFDFTLNSMTLLGLTLAVGIVIDDAIIVLENIYRHIQEKGLPARQAAVVATKEISLAVMATTLSLVIIFVPIAFMTGYARRYLNEFGWTMAASIMISMLVAFTLTPTLSARVLKKRVRAASASRCMDITWRVLRSPPDACWLVAGSPLGHWFRGGTDFCFHLRSQPDDRSRLDAAGGSERTLRFPRTAGRLLD
jgi:HAE1 family hydrophobic/amphiphilic exporter-1